MLSKNDLLYQDTLPHINDVSLKLYKEFSVDVLLKQRFHYYFTDGTDIVVECRKWGIYHMLSIQHIDYTISKEEFFNKIDNGLSLNDFTINRAIKNRYKLQKERITMFACLYQALRYGRIFYLPNGKVPNTIEVRVDYLIYRQIGTKGMNVGMRYEDGCFVPLTILISKAINIEKYTKGTTKKVVSRLHITDISTGDTLEDIIYTDNFIMHT